MPVLGSDPVFLLHCDSCSTDFHCRIDVTVLYTTFAQGRDPSLIGKQLIEVAGHA
jgi:hypothetical protein